jgi:hypothetical protein
MAEVHSESIVRMGILIRKQIEIAEESGKVEAARALRVTLKNYKFLIERNNYPE